MSGSRSSAATRTPESPKQSARKRKDLSDLLVVGGAPVRRRQASTGGAIFVRHGTRCCSLACFFFFLGSVPLRSSCSVGDSSSADVRSSPDPARLARWIPTVSSVPGYNFKRSSRRGRATGCPLCGYDKAEGTQRTTAFSLLVP